MTKKLSDKYDAKTREKFWQNHWAENKIYKFKNDKSREQTFVIDTPPPTVSGVLHMGHVFSYTQADFVVRFQRMSGKDVFYPMGFDDNGLPTERLVEKIIEKKATVFEAENGHGSFVNKCREIVDESEKEFEVLFNAIALSVDWEQKYQTISPNSQRISQASFLDLYNKGFVEKKFEPVFWDISDRTALAQADLIDKEVEGVMNFILFGIEGLSEKIEIMTTRPELLPACVAVMVHPEDSRYKHLHGKFAVTPLFGVCVPIIADEDVQLDKGTGAVMCCTFGDETDIRWWKRHNLETKVIIKEDGKIVGTHHSVKQYKDHIIHQLQEQNLLLKQEPIKRAVKCAERSGVPIEILVVPQWFVKILDKKDLLKAKAAECNWFPQYMKVRIDQWIDGLAWDWCISRQRFFGVKFPVWYVLKLEEKSVGEIIVADVDQLPCDPEIDLPKFLQNPDFVSYDENKKSRIVTKNGIKYAVTAETDIMDTWATSSVSPQLSSNGISNEIAFDKARHEKLFPADLRPQAHEIIRTWAFYTIVKAALHQNSIPWKNLMISGWCLAADKTKMSKSKGNVVTPTSLIEEKGCDIVRYWASTSHLGADTAYSEDVFKIGQKLVTKIFNAAKFCSMNFSLLQENAKVTEASDLWILSRLHETAKKATQEFEKFEYARAREQIEEFFWHDFCDNYLEICKVRSYGLSAEKLAGLELSESEKAKIIEGQQSAILTLKICLNNLLKLFAPFIPHICDEIYAVIFEEEFAQTKSISARGNWAKFDEIKFDQKALDLGNAALEIIFEVRKFKSEQNISMKTMVEKIEVNSAAFFKKINENYLENSVIKEEGEPARIGSRGVVPDYDQKDFLLMKSDLENVCNAKEINLVVENSIEYFVKIIA